ncbi:putative small heat shock protein [hydrocarbon metagenome]|uniref:Putative small heat shock protein n=1 Tax=hydrocarbon metagenome TaxID=938273 RepID=A0A0W8FHV5_9ZZZZ
MSPIVCSYSDESGENLIIEIELPGVDKENISLRMREDSFTIDASKEDIRYIGTYTMWCPVTPDQAKAEYRNGLLTIRVPYKEIPVEEAREVPIEA